MVLHKATYLVHKCYYRPQRSCGQGYVFTRVCDSVHRGGVSPGRHLPPRDQADTPPLDQADTPPRPGRPPGPGRPPQTRQTPPDQADPPGPGRPPPREEDCSIRSMSGRYASYWNAFLFDMYFRNRDLAPAALLSLKKYTCKFPPKPMRETDDIWSHIMNS